MPENDESVTDESTETTATEDATAEETSTEETATEVDPDAGAKKALVAERNARKAAEKRAILAEQQLANKDKPAEELALDAARREGETAATAKANERVLKSELQRAATGKLADPADALVYLNTADFEVGEDGEVDSDALNEAIADLIKKKPYLAATGGSRFGGTADQGAKGKGTGPAQLSQNDLDRMTPSQIAAATAKGQFNTLLGIPN